jgi:hypothetical protein
MVSRKRRSKMSNREAVDDVVFCHSTGFKIYVVAYLADEIKYEGEQAKNICAKSVEEAIDIFRLTHPHQKLICVELLATETFSTYEEEKNNS